MTRRGDRQACDDAAAEREPRRAEREGSAPALQAQPLHLARRSLLAPADRLLVGVFLTFVWYGTSTYYVTFDDDEVVIYRGRPGGQLWIDPERREKARHRA